MHKKNWRGKKNHRHAHKHNQVPCQSLFNNGVKVCNPKYAQSLRNCKPKQPHKVIH